MTEYRSCIISNPFLRIRNDRRFIRQEEISSGIKVMEFGRSSETSHFHTLIFIYITVSVYFE